MTWQPIETAPKDGTNVLMYGPYDEIGVTSFRRGKWWYMANGYIAIENESDFGTEYHEFSSPTHWMPLPEPPK